MSEAYKQTHDSAGNKYGELNPPQPKTAAGEEDMCQGCINCDGTRTLIMDFLIKAYQNGLTDVVAKSEGVIENNKHYLPMLRFMCDDIMKELATSTRNKTSNDL